jgi:hypothetical protein
VISILGTSAASTNPSTVGVGVEFGETVDDLELNDREEQSVFGDDDSVADSIGSNGGEMNGLETVDGDVINDENNDTNDMTVNSAMGNSKALSEVKGMNIVKMNIDATGDYYKAGVKKLMDSKIGEERLESMKRKDREEHFLIDKLFERIQEMDTGRISDTSLAPNPAKPGALQVQIDFREYVRSKLS